MHEVLATMDFCPRGEKVIFYPTDRKKSQWPYTPHRVTIRDMRPIQRELSLAKNGFVLINQHSACTDFYDSAMVERVYVPEVTEIVRKLTGADKTIAFGIMTRTNNPAAKEGNLPARAAMLATQDLIARNRGHQR